MLHFGTEEIILTAIIIYGICFWGVTGIFYWLRKAIKSLFN